MRLDRGLGLAELEGLRDRDLLAVDEGSETSTFCTMKMERQELERGLLRVGSPGATQAS